MKRIFAFINNPQDSIGFAVLIMGLFMLLSRILGLFRDRMLASFFDPSQLGIYIAAFRLPNLLFEMLVMGAFTTAFIPVFTRYITNNQKNEAYVMSSILVNITTTILFVLLLPLLIFTEPICRIFAPGFTSYEIDQMVFFTRLMLILQVIPLMVGNFFTGILQSYKYFLIPSIAPVLYNVGIITGIYVFTPMYGLLAPVVGTGIGALLFLGVQFPFLYRIGYRHSWVIKTTHKGVNEVFRLIIPRTFGLAVSQIDTTIDLILSSYLGTTMVTVFYFAQHLQYMPVGLFGTTLAQALLPTLSRLQTKGEQYVFRELLFSSLLQLAFVLFPISALFITLRLPIIRLVFGGDQYNWQATVLTAQTLSFFAISIYFQGAIPILTRTYYALNDSKTPVVISILSVFVNAVLSYIFIRVFVFPVWSLGLSASIACIMYAFLLFFFLQKRLSAQIPKKLVLTMVKILFSVFCMTIGMYIPLKLFDQLVFDTTRTVGLFFLTTCAMSIGVIVYIFVSWMLGVEELYSYVSFFKKIQMKFMKSGYIEGELTKP